MWPLRTALLRSCESGAVPSVYCASSPEIEGVTGKYFGASKSGAPEQVESSERSQDAALNQEVWKVTDSLVGGAWDTQWEAKTT